MKKAKQYLLENGKIQAITRGRISHDNHSFLAEAYSNGVRFSDWEPKEGISKTTGAKITTNAKVEEKQADPSYNIVYTYPEEQYRAYEFDNGKKISRSMRSICFTCGVSLVGHGCSTPEIVRRDGRGMVRVYIEGV